MHRTLFWIITSMILFAMLAPSGQGTGGAATNMHMMVFIGFSYLLSLAYFNATGQALLVSVLFGLFTEVLQLLSGYRVFSVLDWHYDNMGSLIGVGIFYIRNRYYGMIYR